MGSHLGQEMMRRILGGNAGFQEEEKAVEHIIFCERCREQAASLLEDLRAQRPGFQVAASLQIVVDLIDRQHRWQVESIDAIGEWTELRRLPIRRSQRDRVRMSKACHTIEFFQLALSHLREETSWEESEFIARLALLSAEAMLKSGKISQICCEDLQAELWTAVANARRRAAEWSRAHQALSYAENHLRQGSGDPRLKACLLSITASTLADEGHVSKALAALESCRAIYEDLSEWAFMARTLVQVANVLESIDPAQGLAALDRANPLIPPDDSYLRMLAELLRVECLIGIEKPKQALSVFRRCSRWLSVNLKARMQIRHKFTGARLLAALGSKQQAERLLEEVIDRDVEHELYKDAFLDLLYLYGHHVKEGDFEKAARVCRRALTDAVLAAISHDQLRELWTQLLEAAGRQAVRQDRLADLRQYLSVHWKHPAATAPQVGFR